MATINLIQIKRSSATDTPTGLANGELAFSFTNVANSLFIGDPRNAVPGTALRIAGGKYGFLHSANVSGDEGGKLTSNSVVITNANNFLDKINVNKVLVGADGTSNTSGFHVQVANVNFVTNTVYVTGGVDEGNIIVDGTVKVNNAVGFVSNVAFDTQVLFVDALNNRVGVGTTTPDVDFTVSGSANVSTDMKVGRDLTVGEDGLFYGNVEIRGVLTTNSAGVGFTGNTNFDNGVLFVDGLNNRVGINNTTPDAALTVIGTANVSANTRIGGNLTVDGATQINNTVSITSNTTVDTRVLHVDVVNDRVGVNTATPDATLQVVGTANVSGNSNISSGRVVITSNATIDYTQLSPSTGNVVIGDTTAPDAKFKVVGTANVSGNVTFYGTGLHNISGNVAFDTSTLFVDATNNRVGVGTTTPDADFQVIGDANVSQDLTVGGWARINDNLNVFGNASVVVSTLEAISNSSGQYVSVANAAKNSTLSVNGTANVSGAVRLGSTLIVDGNTTINNVVTISSNTTIDGGVFFVDSVSNRVGVNKTNPSYDLDVTGIIRATGNTYVNGALVVNLTSQFDANLAVDTNVLFVDVVNNRVGINTTTPSQDLNVVGNTAITNNATIGNNLTVTANVVANNLTVNNNVIIQGNLEVNGTLTTIDTVNLVVEDPLIFLAKNNNVANGVSVDAIDAGFYSVYTPDGVTDYFTGLIRDASGSGKYRLFTGLDTQPTTTVDTTDPSYTVATLVAHLEDSNVTITGGSITGITDLAVADGGTGRSSLTAAGIMYGNTTGPIGVTAAGANGNVLQVVNNLPAFGMLDGGTF